LKIKSGLALAIHVIVDNTVGWGDLVTDLPRCFKVPAPDALPAALFVAQAKRLTLQFSTSRTVRRILTGNKDNSGNSKFRPNR